MLVFVGVGIGLALGLTRDPSVVPSALIDKPVPEFTLPPLLKDGQGLASADLKGKVQLVNVFASWCVPCRIEHPVLMRLAKEQGVTVKAINYKDKPEDAVRWLNQGGNPYSAIGADQDGRVVDRLGRLRRAGNLRDRCPGPHPLQGRRPRACRTRSSGTSCR